MEYINITKAVLVLILISLVVYDIFIIFIGGPKPSVSRVLLQWSLDCPLVPLIVGILIGHIFTYQVINKQ